jgi:UDP-galactose transporter B1
MYNTTVKGQHQPSQQRGPASLALCVVGICSCYIYYGLLQERYFSGPNRIGANFALVSQTATNSVVALAWSRIEALFRSNKQVVHKQNSKGLNHALLLLTSFCYIGAMSTSNHSFHYVTYPTAVLAKSCKLIPTMVMSIWIERKQYAAQEWLAAGCITLGIVIFNLSRLSDKGSDTSDSWHGIVLLLISLGMDGFLGSCQGLLKRRDVKGNKQRPPTAMETMLYVNLYALLWLVPMAWYSGEWTEGIARLDEIKEGMFLLNAAAASGQVFIFLTLTWFTPLICTTITTTRKFFTILLSVLHFGHVFSATQWTAIGLVFGGLYTGIVHKAKSSSTTAATKSEKVE